MPINCPECGQHRGAEGFLEGAVQRGAELMGEVETLKARIAVLEAERDSLKKEAIRRGVGMAFPGGVDPLANG